MRHQDRRDYTRNWRVSATRNTRHFDDLPLAQIDPWAG
jgi:hypothetical protein